MSPLAPDETPLKRGVAVGHTLTLDLDRRKEHTNPMTGIPNYFQTDNFAARRSGAGEVNYGNAYDPESLLTGAEEAAGLTYRDKRIWPSTEVYREAVAGRISPDLIIPSIAPRVRILNAAPGGLADLLASAGFTPAPRLDNGVPA